MIRDKLKDEKYFFSRYNKDIENLKDSLNECNEILQEASNDIQGIRLCYYDNYATALETFYSGYSLGLSKLELSKYVDIIIENAILSWQGTVYGTIETIMYLSIIFNTNDSVKRKISNLLIENNYKDKYLYTLASYIDIEFVDTTNKVMFPKETNLLLDIIEVAKDNKELSIIRLKKYLDKNWINMQKEGIITNRDHLSKNNYRGYWSLEAVALVKMLDLDDSILKEHEYYPYDLIH